MINLNVTIPEGDIQAMRATFDRYVQWFSKGPKEAVKKTCVYIVRSLRADTKKNGAKFRKVVKNPNYTMPTSKRARQVLHIRAYYAGKGKEFTDTADYNRYAIQRKTQKKGDKYISIPSIGDITKAREFARSNMMDQLLIKNRGLANSSWGWMLGKLGKKTATTQQQIAQTTEVNESAVKDSYFAELINRLSYIRKSMKVNTQSVIMRAQKSMIDEMEGHIKRARRESGLRAV